jgi:23S rRNA G2445 N2-methylase RlmL
VPGRKIIEMRGDQETLWKILSRSRIAEDLQVKACHEFMARGEKELESNLQKIPWHVYMPSDERHTQFELPKVTAKSFKSKLYHD